MTLRDAWPERGVGITMQHPIGWKPADKRPEKLSPGSTWFSEDGERVWYWTGSEAVEMSA